MTQRRWQVLFWAAAIFAFVMAVLPHPPRIPGQPNDKIQHVIAFATLAALGRAAFARGAIPRLLVGLSLFGGLIELVQLYPPLNRDGDWVDWLADTGAVALVLAAARLIAR